MTHEENNSSQEEETEDFHSSSGNLMDTKTSHLDDLLNEKLEKAFYEETSLVNLHDIAKIASEHEAIDLAYAAYRLPHTARIVLYKNLPDCEAKRHFIINTDATTRIVVCRDLEDSELAILLSDIASDEAIDFAENLSERRFNRVLELIEKEKALHIRDLKKHGRNTAGRLMTNEFFSFTRETTIGEASAEIRENPGIDLTRRIFVINEEGGVQGFVPARNLIINPPHLPLRQVMRSIMHKISPEATRDEVVDIVERYKIPALPVVDGNDKLLGVITYEDVVEAIEDIADESFARMAGTTEDVGEYEPTINRFLARAPWLFFTLCAGLATVSIISFAGHVQGAWITSLLFVVPLITAMSGNVGIQCSTVLVRSMATGMVSSGTKGEAVSKEIVIGLTTGIFFGIIAGFIVYTFDILAITSDGPSNFVMACIVSLGILGACLTATFLGVFSPLFFARIGIDPAIAAGPIVTAFNDVLSTIMYLLIAYWVTALLY